MPSRVSITKRSIAIAILTATVVFLEYRSASNRVGDDNEDIMGIQTAIHTGSWLQESVTWIMTHFPEVRDPPFCLIHNRRSHPVELQIAFTIRAARNPTRLPEFMARLSLLQTSARGIAQSINGVLIHSNNAHGNLNAIRQVYEAGTITNVVADGTVPFRADSAQGKSGITLEFRCAMVVVCLAIVSLRPT